MQIYRLTKKRYADAAFDGAGSMRSDGRWHRAGTPVVYASDTSAGALLEVIAHTEAAALLKHSYVLFTIELEPRRHLLRLSAERLPGDWRALQWPASTQHIGMRWFDDQDSVALEVPSAVIPQQNNYLINPRHPHFEELELGGPSPFEIDSRLG